jgi:hypothetical protein
MLLRHARSNAVGYVALMVALGGTSYAAVSLPSRSVGPKQLKTNAVTTNGGTVTPGGQLSSIEIGGVLVGS